jgi:hypothetical protein
LTRLETTWKNRWLMSKDIGVLFLFPVVSIHVKRKRKSYFLTSPLIFNGQNKFLFTSLLRNIRVSTSASLVLILFHALYCTNKDVAIVLTPSKTETGK